MGLFGMFLYFFLLFFQPNLLSKTYEVPVAVDHKIYKGDTDNSRPLHNIRVTWSATSHYNFTFYVTFCLFIISMLYTASFLPYGRFFQEIGGNLGLGLSYIYIFSYLALPSYRSGINVFELIYRFGVVRPILRKIEMSHIYFRDEEGESFAPYSPSTRFLHYQIYDVNKGYPADTLAYNS